MSRYDLQQDQLLRPSNTASMANGTVPVSLISWTQDRIIALYRATNSDTFDAAFDTLLHDDVQIYVNGVRLTRDEYKRRIQGQRPTAHAATVAFFNCVPVPVKIIGNQEVP